MDPQTTPDRDIFGRMSNTHTDWSHRRGEPRVFALLWMAYLMAMTTLMFASMSGAYTISHSVIRPAARSMLLGTVMGVAILWPLVRFSQSIPQNRTLVWALRDWLVIVVPLQAVVLPQMFPVLAGWSVGTVLAIDALISVWALVIAGLVAMGQRSIGNGRAQLAGRCAWMTIVMIVVLAAPVYGMITGAGADAGVDTARVGWLLSPMTGVLELSRDRSVLGMDAMIHASHWRLIAAIGCVGVAMLLFGYAFEVARRTDRG